MKKTASALIFALAAVFLLPVAARAQAVVSITPLDASSATWTNNAVFVFGANFGLSNVASICVRWDNNPTYAFNGADTGLSCGAGETSWTSGIQTENAGSEGQWYFHAEGFDSGGAAGTQEDAGPFGYDATAPTASNFKSVSSTGGALGESQWNTSASSITAEITVQDATSGLMVSSGTNYVATDGHDISSPVRQYGVIYSTDAGQSWVEWSAGQGTYLDLASGGVYSLAAFKNNLFNLNYSNGLEVSSDGNTWSNVGSIPTVNDRMSFAQFNGKFYVGASGSVYSSATGFSWSPTSFQASSGAVNSLFGFNGDLYAASASSGVYRTPDGSAWTLVLSTTVTAGPVYSLMSFHGSLYAAAANGVYVSSDGVDWSSVLSLSTSQGALAIYNNKLYVGTSGSIYSSSDGQSWFTASNIATNEAFAEFGGRLYLAAFSLYDTTDGSNWQVDSNPAYYFANDDSLSGFNDQLYLGSTYAGSLYNSVAQLTPVAASLTGADGTTSAQTLSTTLNLVSSTNTTTCGGASRCGATNQVIFTASDQAGNVVSAGPFAVLVDTTVGLALSTPTYPNGNVNVQPNFDWQGPSTSVVAGLSSGAHYELQVSKGDLSFGAGNIAIDISTPAVVASTMVPTADGAYVYSGTLSDATTYYWRVRTVDGNGAPSGWSATASFATDFTKPSASGFASIAPGGPVGEVSYNSLSKGVTVQVTLQDSGTGLAVSTDALAFAGDGHDEPQTASGFGVMYSTDAGQSWIDDSATSTVGGGTVGTEIMSLAAFNGNLYAGDFSSGKIYTSPDGNSWSATKGGLAVGNRIRPLAVFNGKLYAGDAGNGKIYATTDGNSWSTVNGGASVGASIQALAVFNGKLYAGDYSNGNIYVSADGNSWTLAASQSALGSSSILALAVFNGRLYGGDAGNGKIYVSADGNSWSATNGGTAVGSSIYSLATFDGKIYAGDEGTGKIYASADGNSWSAVNGTAAVGSQIVSLAAFDGKLYAADFSNGLYVSADGNSWTLAASSATLGALNIYGLADFNGNLYAGDDGNGKIYRISPLSAVLPGSNGETTAQTLTASGLNLAGSTNTVTCGGISHCGATNQVIFTGSDMAGNVVTAGPYAILVDTSLVAAISTPTYPTNDVNVQPNFDWIGAATATIAGITSPSYILQVSKGDPNFGAGNIVISISTPAVIASTMVPTADGAYISTFTLASNAIYYWRVATENGLLGDQGLWSQTASFTTDFASPTASSFYSVGNQGVLSENQINALSQGVTVQMTLQDAGTGLAVSTSALAFAGDGHNDPQFATSFGVMYSTNDGLSWIDASTITVSNGGAPVGNGVHALAIFNGEIYAGELNGDVYASADGKSWSPVHGGVPIGGTVRALTVFNGKLYAGDADGSVYVSADGNVWNATNGGMAVGTDIFSLSVFNDKLYAGDSTGRVYESSDGTFWSASNGGAPIGGVANSLVVFNGRLYDGDSNGHVFVSANGETWTDTQGGIALGGTIKALSVFDGKLYAAGYLPASVYATSDGNSWTTTNGGASIGTDLDTLAAFDGKLYAADFQSGQVFVSVDGSSWTTINNGAPIGSVISSLAAFNGNLYAGDSTGGDIYQIAPIPTALTGFNGSTSMQTISASGLNFAASTTTTVCGGISPCGATNQVIFTASDLAGNIVKSGPWAVLVTTVPTVQAVFANAAPAAAAQGSQTAFVRIQLNTAAGSAPWSSLVVSGLGTDLASDVNGVSVWRDANDDGLFEPGTDVEISNAGQNFTSGVATVTFTSSENLTTTPKNYFVVFNINSQALGGDDLQAEISSATAFNFSGQNWNVQTSTALPFISSQTVITASTATVTLTPYSDAPTAASPGQNDVPVLRITGQTGSGTVKISSIVFHLAGNAPSNSVSSIALYRDANGDGIFESGTDSLVSSGLDDFVNGVATVAFTSSASSATVSDSPAIFFAVMGLSGGAPIGDTLGLQLDTTSDVVLSNSSNTVSFSTQPFASNLFPIELANTLTVSPMSETPAELSQGGEYAVLEATLTVDSGQMTITQIAVRRSGSGLDSDVSAVKVYQDPNPPEAFNPVTFNLLGQGTFSGGLADISINRTLSASTTYVYYISYALSPTAQAGDTLAANLSAASAVSITNPIGTVAGPFPFVSSTGTIVATEAGLDVSGQDATPGSLPQGATAVQMLNLQVNTTQYELALQGLTVNALGSAADSDVTELRLYEDNVGNGVLNISSDTELASLSSPFHSGVAFLSLGTPLTAGLTKTGLILAVDISSRANYNADLGLSVSSASSVAVNAPNFVVNSGFPINSSVIPISKSPDVLSVLPENLISSGVIQGVETPVMRITAWASPVFSVWKQANFTRLGTLSDAGIAAVKVYLDANGNGVWDGSDVLIGTGTVASGVADVQFSTAQTVGVSSSVYFVTLTPTANATIGDTVGLALSGASQLSVLSPDSVSGANLPFQTALAQVLDGRTPETPAVTLPTGQYDGTFDSLSFVWTSTVALGSINSASYAIGTTPGGTDIRGFTPIIPASSTTYTATGLLLFTGTSYYVSVKVGSSLGYTSPTGESVGQLVDTTIPGAPTPLSITPGQTTVIASWPAATAGPSGIRGYLLQYMNLDSPVWYNAKTQGQIVEGLDALSPESVDLSTTSLVTPPAGVENLPAGTYLFQIQSVSGAGLLSTPSSPIRVLVGSTPGSDFSGLSSYPNPFDSRSGQATIVYDLTANEDVTIKIFDVFGGLVRDMHFSAGENGGLQGTNNVTWDGADGTGRKVSKGIYIAVFQSSGARTTYKIGVIH